MPEPRTTLGKCNFSLTLLTYGISLQNKNAEEERNTTRGTRASVTRADELALLTARGLDRFD
eukprot:16109932-Heterocapsa_arctica.AAC.1